MATFILVPGAWHGSWAFEAVVPRLERAGHTVHALTLTGLRPDDDVATVASANLDTHAADVVSLLDRARVTDARLRVMGFDRLRVIDASVMPTITSGNTNTPTIMIAEKGARLVLEDA